MNDKERSSGRREPELSRREVIMILGTSGRLAGVELSGLDLSSLSFAGCELSRSSLVKANLAQADFSFAHMVKTDLSYSEIQGATFIQTDFTEAVLNDIDLRHARALRRIDWGKVDLSGRSLSELDDKLEIEGGSFYWTSFENSDLTGAIFSADVNELLRVKTRGEDLSRDSPNFFRANFTGAILQQVEFIGVGLVRCDFTNADLRGAVFKHLFLKTKKSMRGLMTIFMENSFVDANLLGVDFRHMNLRSSDFKGAIFGECVLTSKTDAKRHRYRTNLENAEISKEQLSQVSRLEGTIMPDGSIY